MPRQAYKSFGHKTQHLDRLLWPRRKKEQEEGDKETEERGSVSGNRHVARDPGAAPRTTDCQTHTHKNCPGAAAIKQQMNSGSNIKWTCMSWPTVHLRLCVCVCDTRHLACIYFLPIGCLHSSVRAAFVLHFMSACSQLFPRTCFASPSRFPIYRLCSAKLNFCYT